MLTIYYNLLINKLQMIANKQKISDHFLWDNLNIEDILVLYKLERQKYQELSANFNINNLCKYFIWYENYIDEIIQISHSKNINKKIKKFIKKISAN